MRRSQLLERLTEDVFGYVMHGHVSERVVTNALAPEGFEQRFSDYRRLVNLHFLLRDDVIDFVRQLPEHLRSLETRTRAHRKRTRGGVDGRINWQETAKARYSESPGNRALFVCDTRSEDYDTAENLVLKELLSRIHSALEDANVFIEREYDWIVDAWIEEDLVDDLRRIFERNVHVKRIRDPEVYEPTDRMIADAEVSRKDIYQEAADLLGTWRDAERGKREAVRDLLNRTTITPDDEETLLELYVLFRVIGSVESIEEGGFTIETIESGRQEVARLSGPRDVVIYHDSSGDRDLSFRTIAENRIDGKPSRNDSVQMKATEIANQYFHEYKFQDHTGRPDVIVLEIGPETDETEYLVAEVKNSTSKDTVRRGIKETLEYLAFLRKGEEFVFDGTNEEDYFGSGWNGMLVIQDLKDTETQPIEDQSLIRILQASELEDELESVLENVLAAR